MATIDELRARAELIAEEQQIGGNTAERVGDAFDMVADIIEAVAPGDQQAVLYNPQSPNEAQKAQARENIGAQETISDIADFVKVSAQTFTAAQKQQARENIGAEQAGGAVKNLAGSASDTETLIKAANNPNLQANVHLSGNNIYVNGIAGGIDLDNNGVNIKAGNSGYPNAKVKVNGQDVATKLYVDGKIDDRADPIEVALAAIEAVIPSQASAQNQLADKAFVNSSISSSTANFVGTFNSLAELQAVQNPTNNDYGFVIETDAVGNEYYDRYKYNGTEWLFEYKVESTPFTAAQWAAIQSGITSALVTKLSALPTNSELTTALNAKADKSDTYTKQEVDDAIAAIDVSSQISGKADKVVNATNGDFAALDANGNLTDSGKNASDFGTAQDVAELRSAYAALTQSDIVVVADHTAVASPVANTIYREPGTTSYSDWMYYGGAWVKIAEYDNGLPVSAEDNAIGDLDISDENGYVLARFNDGQIRTKNFYSGNVYNKTQIDTALNAKQDALVSGVNIKTIDNIPMLGSGNIDIIRTRHLKLLVIGNSYSADSFMYVPFILMNYGITIELGIYLRGGASLQNQVDEWNTGNGSACLYYINTKTQTSWQVISTNTSPQYSVGYKTWDIITIQQSSVASVDYSTYAVARDLIELIESAVDYPFTIAWNININRDSSGSDYTSIANQILTNIDTACQREPVNIIFPYGTAIFDARTNSVLNAIGGGGSLYAADKVHLQEGLPCYIAAIANVQTLFNTFYPGLSVLNDSVGASITQSLINSWNVQGQNGTCTGISVENCRLGQICAILANRYKFEIKTIY